MHLFNMRGGGSLTLLNTVKPKGAPTCTRCRRGEGYRTLVSECHTLLLSVQVFPDHPHSAPASGYHPIDVQAKSQDQNHQAHFDK
jgi:hypothetical protein